MPQKGGAVPSVGSQVHEGAPRELPNLNSFMATAPSRRLGLLPLLLLAACSPGASPSSSSSEASSTALASSPQAASLLTSLRQQFLLAPPPSFAPDTLGNLAKTFPSRTTEPTPLLPPSEVERYEVQDGWVIPNLPESAFRGRLRPARVRLPLRASGAFEVRDEKSGMELRVQRAGGTEAPVEAAEGWALYRGGLRGGDVLHRVHGEGTEDYVYFPSKPEVEELRYTVDVSAVAGLRLVSNVVELLDKEGYPRLRVQAPLAVDARGEQLALRLGVEGCAYDENPAAPWERAVVEPGKEACEVVVRWEGGAYPLVVDPAFVSTGSMAVGRQGHTANVLSDGSVLVIGGGNGNHSSECPGGFCRLAERWINGVFSAAGSMAVGRMYHTASLLSDGSVLIVAGMNQASIWNSEPTCPGSACTTMERWENGVFSGAGSLPTGLTYHTATVLSDGSVLLIGGYTPTMHPDCPSGACRTAMRWADGALSPAGTLAVGRSGHTASLLGDGTVLVVGGVNPNEATACPNAFCKTAERWTNGSFSSAGSLAVGRHLHTASVLGDGSVVVVGGRNSNNPSACPGDSCRTAERWNNGVFSPAGSMAAGRMYHTASVLSDDSILIAGGYDNHPGSSCEKICKSGSLVGQGCLRAERWVDGIFSPAGSMERGRHLHTASDLPVGSILLVGGETNTAELWDPNVSDLGQACTDSGCCSSGFCVEGVCCNSTCPDGSCHSSKTGQPDGTCAPLLDGHSCSDPTSCASGFCVDGVCCDKPCDGICEACKASIKGFGANGVCEPIRANTDPENECSVLGVGICQSNGFCDGSKAACQSKAGTTCLPSSCADATNQLNSSVCDANGQCVSQGTSSCSPYACKGSGCLSSCSDHSDCAPGFACINNQCVEPQGLGTPCTLSLECQSEFCVEGVCCDQLCDGPCQSCLALHKGDGSSSGSCGAVLPGTDPKDLCDPDLENSCGATGQCGINGQCEAFAPAKTSCGSQQSECSEDGSSVIEKRCNGQGECIPEQQATCGNYLCKEGQCPDFCSTSSDCAADYICQDNACVKNSTGEGGAAGNGGSSPGGEGGSSPGGEGGSSPGGEGGSSPGGEGGSSPGGEGGSSPGGEGGSSPGGEGGSSPGGNGGANVSGNGGANASGNGGISAGTSGAANAGGGGGGGGGSGAAGSNAAGNSSSAGTASLAPGMDLEGGCSCTVPSSSSSRPGLWLGAAVGWAAWLRRRHLPRLSRHEKRPKRQSP